MKTETVISLIATLTDFLNKVNASEIGEVKSVDDTTNLRITKNNVIIYVSVCARSNGKTLLSLEHATYTMELREPLKFSIADKLDISDYRYRSDALLCAIKRIKALYEEVVDCHETMIVQSFINKLNKLMTN